MTTFCDIILGVIFTLALHYSYLIVSLHVKDIVYVYNAHFVYFIISSWPTIMMIVYMLTIPQLFF
jgi:hypothetical protein